jgi:hypothetical protein
MVFFLGGVSQNNITVLGSLTLYIGFGAPPGGANPKGPFGGLVFMGPFGGPVG